MYYMRIHMWVRQEITPALRAQATTLLRGVLDDVYANSAAFGDFWCIRQGFELEGRGRVEAEFEFDTYTHADMKQYLRDLVSGKPLDAQVRVWSKDPDGEVLSASRTGSTIEWTEYEIPQPPTVSQEE